MMWDPCRCGHARHLHPPRKRLVGGVTTEWDWYGPCKDCKCKSFRRPLPWTDDEVLAVVRQLLQERPQWLRSELAGEVERRAARAQRRATMASLQRALDQLGEAGEAFTTQTEPWTPWWVESARTMTVGQFDAGKAA